MWLKLPSEKNMFFQAPDEPIPIFDQGPVHDPAGGAYTMHSPDTLDNRIEDFMSPHFSQNSSIGRTVRMVAYVVTVANDKL